jgi:phytoene dehydrogenase-like protein
MMQPRTRDFDVIVIGSGIGGLTVASLMTQLKGSRVLVLERHFKLGGFTHSFNRPGGRTWDVGLHYVGGMDPAEPSRQLFDLITARGVEWRKMVSPFEKFVYPDFTFDVPDSEERYREALITRYPLERGAIETYFKDLRAAASWFGARIMAQAMPAPVGRLARLVNQRKDPLALSTTGEYLDERFRDPQLKALLASQWGDYGLPPSESAFAIHALVVGSYLGGGYHPVGGAGTIAKSVREVVEANGGQCLVNHRANEIIVSHGKAVGVRTTSPRFPRNAPDEFFAPVVVSDAGAYTTFCRLLPASVPIAFRADLERRATGHGFVTLYLAFKDTPAALGFQGENHWIYDGYDHDALFRNRRALLEGQPVACYLSMASLNDPAATAHTAQIIAFLDYEAVEAWKDEPWRNRGEGYEALKHRIAEGLLDFVDRRYPGFKALVDYCEVSTPLTVENFTEHRNGTAYGIPATPERFRLSYLDVATPVENLYLTGSDVASPGIVGAMMGGVLTSARLMGSLGLFRIFAAARRSGKRPAGDSETVAA